MKLRIELVPAPLWGMSLRKELPRSEWTKLRRWALDRAGNACAPCGTVVDGGQGMVCHEVWEYDDQHAVQTLVEVEIHCQPCDRVTHIGHTGRVLGEEAKAAAQNRLIDVNGLTPEQAEEYQSAVWQTWRERCDKSWSQDRSWYDRWLAGHEKQAETLF